LYCCCFISWSSLYLKISSTLCTVCPILHWLNNISSLQKLLHDSVCNTVYFYYKGNFLGIHSFHTFALFKIHFRKKLYVLCLYCCCFISWSSLYLKISSTLCTVCPILHWLNNISSLQNDKPSSLAVSYIVSIHSHCLKYILENGRHSCLIICGSILHFLSYFFCLLKNRPFLVVKHSFKLGCWFCLHSVESLYDQDYLHLWRSNTKYWYCRTDSSSP
jgi:hypothetical protein